MRFAFRAWPLFLIGALVTGALWAGGTRIAAMTIEPTTGIVVGGPVTSHEAPWSSTPVVNQLYDLDHVTIVGMELGENWIVGGQDWWYIAFQDWQNVWYLLENGSYIYSAFVFVPMFGETSPFAWAERDDRWIDVNLSTQYAAAMIGDVPVHWMPITTGRDEFATPTGEFTIRPWGRIANERMTSAGAGIDDPAEYYDVWNVLFTQYFTDAGHALHLNYWQVPEAFGGWPTSHGCAGVLLHDAQWLWIFGEPGMRVSVHY